MIHKPEWIPAWRLKQAYSLTEADILSLVQSLGEQAHISFNSAWGMLQEYFLKPQIEAMPEHWRSTLDGIFDDPRVVNSPSWIVRAFNERDRLYESLRIVAAQTDSGKFCDAVTTLFESIYEGEPPSISTDVFCAPFVTPNGDESSRLFSQIFHETLLFNKYAAVEAFEKAHYPLIAEVKGITKCFVKTVRERMALFPNLPVATTVISQADISPKLLNAIPAITPPALKKKNKGHGAISGATAAGLLGVSQRTIRTWEADPQKAPKGYPGRNDEAAFQLFVNAYQQNKRLIGQARAMNKAVSGGINPDLYGNDDGNET